MSDSRENERCPWRPNSLSTVASPDDGRAHALDAMPLRRVDTDIRDLLRASLELLRRQADAFDISLTVRVDDNVPAAVPMDRVKIAWAITAVVGNALRYVRHGSTTMPGGSIVVHAGYDGVRRDISIDIQDDGPGMSRDMLALLSAGAAEGSLPTALGLTMVRDVVTAHGGSFSIDSETDRQSCGTRVRLTLPAAG